MALLAGNPPDFSASGLRAERRAPAQRDPEAQVRGILVGLESADPRAGRHRRRNHDGSAACARLASIWSNFACSYHRNAVRSPTGNAALTGTADRWQRINRRYLTGKRRAGRHTAARSASPSIVIYSLGAAGSASTWQDAALLGELNAIVSECQPTCSPVTTAVRAEAYAGLDFDFADFSDYHFYADLRRFAPLLQHFYRGGGPASGSSANTATQATTATRRVERGGERRVARSTRRGESRLNTGLRTGNAYGGTRTRSAMRGWSSLSPKIVFKAQVHPRTHARPITSAVTFSRRARHADRHIGRL